ncbi:restriction endonuclease subunit S [Megasphaera sp.]|uniref:restriction endonuclease subunit S n=1 Tax=Megasphaera sp. TaxID=2023260 RepID=UPI003522091C
MRKETKKAPTIRFRGFTDDWEQRKLGEIVDRVTRKNKNLEATRPLTISAQYGLIDQSEFFDKRVASKDISGYYLIKNGEFAYNKSTSTDAPWGAIKRLDLYKNGVLSTLYIVFSIHNSQMVDSNYLASYYETHFWHKEIHAIAAEGARNHGLLNITPDDFFSTSLLLPRSSEEQKKIGFFAHKLDHLIILHQRKLNQLKTLKKYFLQNMFPAKGEKVPRIRFKGFTGDWEQRKLKDIADSYSGGTPSVGQKKYYEGNIPFIRSAEINSNSTELFLSEEGLKNSSAKIVAEGDILYALYGATSGEVGRSRLNGAINQAILAIQPHAEFDSEFIMQWLRKSKKAIISKYLQGGQGNLSGTIVTGLEINLPTYSEQKIIGEYFQHIDNLITLHQRKLDQLQTMKKFMLQNLFI